MFNAVNFWYFQLNLKNVSFQACMKYGISFCASENIVLKKYQIQQIKFFLKTRRKMFRISKLSNGSAANIYTATLGHTKEVTSIEMTEVQNKEFELHQ